VHDGLKKVRIVEQFSSSYDGVDEKRITQRVIENDKYLRCTVTTIALGMGVDMKDIDMVIHWGASDNVLRYWQEVGRAGRSGANAEAHLFAYPMSLVGAKVDKSMKELVKKVVGGACVRKEILGFLKLEGIEDQAEPSVQICTLSCVTCVCRLCMCCCSCLNKCPCVSQEI